jgi:MFS family permease
MEPPPNPQTIDEEHLNLLSIFHYIVGGLDIVLSSFFLAYVGIGIFIIIQPEALMEIQTSEGKLSETLPPPLLTAGGWLLAVFGAITVVSGWILGILTVISGRHIARRRTRIFSVVVAVINCLSIPFGTALGIFTIIVLTRPSVRRLYEPGSTS